MPAKVVQAATVIEGAGAGGDVGLAGRPGAGEGARLVVDAGQLGGDQGVGAVVEVAPGLLPGLWPAVPAAGRAGQAHLQAFGEARLARPVAADDEGQARPRVEVEEAARADAPEALDGDAVEEDAGGGAASRGARCGDVRFGPSRPAHLVEWHIRAGGQDQIGGGLVQVGGVEALPDGIDQLVIQHVRGPSGGLRAGCGVQANTIGGVSDDGT